APVLLQGAVLSLLAGLLFALTPALHYSRPGVEEALVEGRPGAGSGPVQQRLRTVLVVGQIALALVLLVGAGVLVRSFQELRSVDLGFEVAGVQTWGIHLPDGRYADPARRASFQAALFERLKTLPGIRYAGAISRLPATGDWFRWGTGLSDASGDRDLDSFIGANQRVVEGDVFQALGIPLLRGRLFGPQDDAEAPHRVVVNQALARRLFPDRDPVGAALWYGPWRARVIGVVGDAAIGPRGERTPKVYHSHRQFAGNRNWALTWVVRLEAPFPGLATSVRREVAGLDPLLVPFGFRPLAETVGRGVARERFATLLVTVFSALAVLLAAVGIYGVLAYTVTRRRREIGVRLALGARGPAVRRMVMGRGLLLASGGVAFGLPAALVLGRLLESLLFEVSPTDPWILSAVSVGMVAVALLASWVPALRATRVDPSETLRSE
ncbi:MAG TPA: FtsX-like permease family protein, partial [Longimicrobiales bacterium]|nr:FtsX-like permease family protein [Longimicrobiales bacterium]